VNSINSYDIAVNECVLNELLYFAIVSRAKRPLFDPKWTFGIAMSAFWGQADMAVAPQKKVCFTQSGH